VGVGGGGGFQPLITSLKEDILNTRSVAINNMSDWGETQNNTSEGGSKVYTTV